MKVIVTRPLLEANAWVKELREKNIDAVALPLIQISAVSNTTDIQQAWTYLHQYHSVMFVSRNAVRYFFGLNNSLDDVEYRKFAIDNIVNKFNEFNKSNKLNRLRFWVTGPGSRYALIEHGVPADAIDAPAPDAAQFDSEALWHRVQSQVNAGYKVLIVRGSSSEAKDDEAVLMNGRPWLADQLTAAGALVDTVVSYQRSAPQFDASEIALMAQASGDSSVWLLSSSEAVANLKAMAGLNWSKARAIATHPRIAQAAREAGFGVVYESRPRLADVAASIESLI